MNNICYFKAYLLVDDLSHLYNSTITSVSISQIKLSNLQNYVPPLKGAPPRFA